MENDYIYTKGWVVINYLYASFDQRRFSSTAAEVGMDGQYYA